MHPHLLQDLRLLWRVTGRGPGRGPPEEQELLREVFGRVSGLAAEALGALCGELGGAPPVAPPPGPDVEVFASGVAAPEETLGLRARRRCPPGALACLYPGRIFLASEQNVPRSNMLFGNEYEGVSMDGAGWLPMQFRDAPALRGQPKTTLWHANRLAMGNLCNHPPRGQLPNLVPMAFRWPTWQELGQPSLALWARLVPHVVMDNGQVVRTASGERREPEKGEDRVWFPPWPHMGMALVTIRNVEAGDELFWNYRLHPRADCPGAVDYPPWYTPVDDAALEAVVHAEMEAAARGGPE